MATASDIELTIVAKDEASPVLRRIRREAIATGLVITHPLLVLTLLLAAAMACGVLLGLLVATHFS